MPNDTIVKERAKNPKTGKITNRIVQWENEGQTLTVTLTNISEFIGKDIKEPCAKYTGVTDEGHAVSFLLGGATDKAMQAAHVAVGDKIKIVYEGKKELTGGRSVNIFDIEYAI